MCRLAVLGLTGFSPASLRAMAAQQASLAAASSSRRSLAVSSELVPSANLIVPRASWLSNFFGTRR